MSCRRVAEIDLAAFLAGTTSAELAEFRAHYPDCPECSAEVRAWIEVHRRLEREGTGLDSPHPAEELLLQFEDRPEAMAAEERRLVEEHLALCHSCRDELGALRSFDFAALGQPVASSRGWWDRVAAATSPVRALLLHPAFAYGIVLLLIAPIVVEHLSPRVRPRERGIAFREPLPERARPETQPKGLVVRDTDRSPEKRVGGAALQANAGLRVTREEEDLRLEDAERNAVAMQYSTGIDSPTDTRALAETREKRDENATAVGVGGSLEPEEFSSRLLARRRGPAKILGPAAVTARESPWVTLAIEPQRKAEVAAGTIHKGVVLRIPLAQESGGAGRIEVRVLSPGGLREVRERVDVHPGSRSVEMRLPAAWLSPGRYRVELRAAEKTHAARLESFVFSVRSGRVSAAR